MIAPPAREEARSAVAAADGPVVDKSGDDQHGERKAHDELGGKHENAAEGAATHASNVFREETGLQPFITAFVKTCPAAGTGVRAWLFQSARL